MTLDDKIEMSMLNSIQLKDGDCIYFRKCYLITGGICYNGCAGFIPYHKKNNDGDE